MKDDKLTKKQKKLLGEAAKKIFLEFHDTLKALANK